VDYLFSRKKDSILNGSFGRDSRPAKECMLFVKQTVHTSLKQDEISKRYFINFKL